MIDGLKLVAIIPARGGSKGIPGKNLLRIGRDTLLERAIKLARSCDKIDVTLVTTDDAEMFSLAQQYNAALPALRPANLSGDNALTIDVVLHSLDQMKLDDCLIILLQPTAPLRTKNDLEKVISLYEKANQKPEAVVSLCEIDGLHPAKAQVLVGGFVAPYEPGMSSVPRQQLRSAYFLNGAFYLIRSHVLRQQRTFIPQLTIPYLMPPERSINLDSIFDLSILESLLAQGKVSLEEFE